MDITMLGVVLWSDTSDRKAVIWCEDQGDLAYLNAGHCFLHTDDFFDAGDLVQFDMEVTQSMRIANNPRLVTEKASTNLPEVLRRGKPDRRYRASVSKVIPFYPVMRTAAATR